MRRGSRQIRQDEGWGEFSQLYLGEDPRQQGRINIRYDKNSSTFGTNMKSCIHALDLNMHFYFSHIDLA